LLGFIYPYSSALGSTDIARRNGSTFPLGAAISGIILFCGENVSGVDMQLVLDDKGKASEVY
jgi:hypothetical protein